jgi:hypothetical protein
MRRTLFLAGLLALLATPAVAQGGGRMAGPPKSGEGLLQGITLTADQQKKVDSVWQANAKQRDQLRAQLQPGQMPDSATRAQMMTMRDQSMKTYRGILTADQTKVFDQNVAAMRERARQMGGPGGPSR